MRTVNVFELRESYLTLNNRGIHYRRDTKIERSFSYKTPSSDQNPKLFVPMGHVVFQVSNSYFFLTDHTAFPDIY